MNPRLGDIFHRRSIRRFLRDEISDETIQDLLDAAMSAPSACCKDPWHFLVIRRKELLQRIAEGLPNGQMLREATVGVAVCGDPVIAHDGQLSYLLQDCSAAIENLLLAASMLGLGACWLGVHPREDRLRHMRATLGIPESILPIAMIAVGSAGEAKPARSRTNLARIHHEQW